MNDQTTERLRSDDPQSATDSGRSKQPAREQGAAKTQMEIRRPAAKPRSDSGESVNVEAEIRSLQARSGQGLWALVVFSAMSLWAGTGFRYFPEIPEGWHEWLGAPPPLSWVHGIFLLYIFSALVLSLTRMAAGWHPFGGFQHLGYLAAFYVFYNISGGLPDNFWAVLVGGFSVLSLESYRNLLQCRQRIRELSGESE